MFDWVIHRLRKYWNFQSEAKLEQIIAITTHSVFLFVLYCCKGILIWQKNIKYFLNNFFEYYFLNIIVNLWFEYYCEYQHKQALNKKLKLMGWAMKYFLTKLMGHEIFSSMSPGLWKIFWKISKTLRPLSYILNVRSLKTKDRKIRGNCN